MPTYTNLCPIGYQPRHIDTLVEQRLATFRAIEIQGTDRINTSLPVHLLRLIAKRGTAVLAEYQE